MLSILLFIYLNFLHAFHLSKTEVNFDTKSQAIQIASKVFIDDLELDLQYNGFKDLKIGTDYEVTYADSLIADYFQKNLLISVDDQVNSNQFFIGKELSEDLIAIWAYIEIPLEKMPSSISVKNTILNRVFDDQKNMVQIKRDNKLIEHSILDVKSFNSTATF